MAYLTLGVQILGEFSLVYDGVAVTDVNSARLQSLLTYLILHTDTPQLRHHVAFLLWPDSPESQARNNLRQFLYQLRHLLPDSDRFLVVDTNTVYWKTDEGQDIDVRLFEYNLKEADALEQRGDKKAVRKMLEQAIVCYKGDLLPACYDDWISPERERLRQLYLNACQKLVGILESQREYVAAIQTAQSRLRLDPLNEGAYVSLIRLHSLNEDYPSARRVYQSAVETLQRELDVGPSEELQSIYDRLRHAPHTMAPFDPSADSNNGSIKLVGRIPEWQQLQSAWQHAIGFGGQFVLITGEAGIGKSRLAEELFNWTTHQGFTTAHTRSYGAEGRLALAPITEWLRNAAVLPYLVSLDPVWLTEIARLLPEILNDYPNLARPGPITEFGRRQRFFEALARGILAAPRPLLLWIDDLQWCDQETLEWLHFFLRFEPHNSLLILGTARSEESPPDHPLSLLVRQLQTEDRVTVIELSPLDAAETARLANQVQGYDLDDRANIYLFRETEGNPLFVVETVRAGMDRTTTLEPDASAAPSQNLPILPPKVQATISGRLANLSPTARKIAEIGAAIGRAFTFDLLLLAGQENDETVIDALDELWQKRIVREQSANMFDFTHDKLREVAYAETSLPQRRLIHRRTAQALETLNIDELGPVSSQIAMHFEQAGLPKKAIPYYQQAGSVAASVFANEDAINLYTRGLDLLEQLPVSAKRDIQELNLQLELATLYRISKGWTSPEEEQVLGRAKALSDKVGSIEQRIRTLFGLQTLYVVQARYHEVEYAVEQAETLFRQAQLTPPPFSDFYLAGVRLFTGQFTEARKLYKKIVAARDSDHIRALQEAQGLNYLVHGLTLNAHVLWCLGYPQLALNDGQAAIDLAREFAEPFNQALAITYLATLQAWRAPAETYHAYAEEAYTLTEEFKAPYYHAWAKVLLCHARAEQQPVTENLAQLRDAIQDFIATGAHIRLPVYFALLAEVCLLAGHLDEGLDALDLASTESEQNDEHWWDAEIHRLRGELLQAQGVGSDKIETIFQQALAIARAQEAKSFELRAAVSLAHLWQADARQSDAKMLLTQIYSWFTEGFDTPDLQTAQHLIAQL